MERKNAENIPGKPLKGVPEGKTKEIERLYEAASKEQGITAKYSTEWKEFERYTDALPQEAWIS